MRLTSERALLIAGYTALCVFHLWSGWQLTVPLILYDEFGHLTSAAYFAGFDWSSITSLTTYYAWGYGFLISPLLRWIGDPYLVYRGALLLNALCASAIFPLAYALAHRLAPGQRPRSVLLAAFVVATYPSYVLLAKFAWSEPVLSAAFWATALGMVGLAGAPDRTRWATALGVAVGALYILHQRGLPIAAAALTTVVLMWAVRALRGRVVASFAAALAATLAVALAVKDHLLAALWLNGPIALHADPAAGLIRDVTPRQWSIPLSLTPVLQILLGEAFYLGAGTLLLAYFGIAAALSLVRSPEHDPTDIRVANRRRAVAAYASLSLAALWITTAVHLRTGSRADHMLYGRYMEAAIGVAILLGLLIVLGGDPLFRARRRACVIAGGLLFIVVGALTIAYCRDALTARGGIVWINISGLLPYHVPQARFDVLGAALSVAAVSAAVYGLAAVWPRMAVALIGAFFLWTGTIGATYLRGEAELARHSTDIADWLRTHDSPLPIYFLRTGKVPIDLVRKRYQFLLGPRPIHDVDAVDSIDPNPGAFFVITARSDLDAVIPGAQRLVAEFDSPLQLWSVGVASAAISEGAEIFSRTPAYRSQLSDARGVPASITLRRPTDVETPLVDQPLAGLTPWGRPSVPVRVEHLDRERWPGNLLLGAFWEREDQPGVRVGEYRATATLPRSPGDAAEIDVPLRPYDHVGAVLDAGRYRLHVALVEEGVRWLYPTGDPILEYSVVIADD